jgi:hypothetical protein
MMPNIVKGKGITGAMAYAMGQGNDPETGERILLKPGEASRAKVLGGQNFGFEIATADDVDLARRMMEFQGMHQANKTRQLDRDCFHASLSWGIGQTPDDDEMRQAATEFLKAVGLEKARAVFIRHDDTDHPHMHIVASRIDPETRRTLNSDNDWIEGQKWALQWEKEHGQERNPEQGVKLRGLVEAVERRDAGAVLAHVTRDKATFQAWELNRVLAYADLTDAESARFKADILGQKNVIGLSDTKGGEVNRYTTTEALAAEMVVQRNALDLARSGGFGVKEKALDAASRQFTLKPEQDAALRHLAGDSGLAILYGQAGTGKSHTLKAVRTVLEEAGKNVIGLSWTNGVVQQMRGDGFKEANTIAGELLQIDRGKKAWDKTTVLIVDEAAQLSTDNLARLTWQASRAGAKLILVGDDKQLSSVERGGLFETLRETHGAAILKDVQRVKDVTQRPLWNEMHEGEFLGMLTAVEKAGGIHWTTRQSDALKAMAAQYSAAVEADPDKRRFMLAYSNADVATLNQQARQLHRQAGKLGEDQILKTAAGPAPFAIGDRIQFTGSGRTNKEKNAGLTNGRVGTIKAIQITKDHKARVTVALDVGKDEKPKAITFTVGADAKAGEFQSFKLGYAGTVYRSQGATLDEIFIAHHKGMRAAASYVALSRHKDNVQLFAARETVKDLATMAKGMARSDGKRAASSYSIDPAILDGITAGIEITRWRARPATRSATRSTSPMTAADHLSARLAAADRSAGRNAPLEAKGLGRAADKLVGIASGIAKLADGFANYAEQTIVALADLLSGGSTAEPPPPKTMSAKERRAADQATFVATERQTYLRALQELAKTIGSVDSPMTEDELRREQEAQRNRDRGGHTR